MKTHETTFRKKLCWNVRLDFCRKKTKLMRLQEKAIERFDNSIDILNIMNLQTNVELLLSLFLTKEQRLLFAHHHKRTLSLSAETKNDDSDSLDSNDKEKPLPDEWVNDFADPESQERSKAAFEKLLGYPAGL